jgi:hypothetical protein
MPGTDKTLSEIALSAEKTLLGCEILLGTGKTLLEIALSADKTLLGCKILLGTGKMFLGCEIVPGTSKTFPRCELKTEIMSVLTVISKKMCMSKEVRAVTIDQSMKSSAETKE